MKLRIIILLLLLSLVLGGCSRGASPERTDTTTLAVPESTQTLSSMSKPTEPPTNEPTEPTTAVPAAPTTVDPRQITEDWNIPKGNVRLLFSCMPQGLRVTNAEGDSYQR